MNTSTGVAIDDLYTTKDSYSDYTGRLIMKHTIHLIMKLNHHYHNI